MQRLKNKVAVILGAGSVGNMGQVIARRFASEGAHVVVAGRKQPVLKALAAEIGGDYHVCDITNSMAVTDLVHFTANKAGKIDVAVNCTGWASMTKLLDVKEDELDRLCSLHIKGVYFFLQHMVAHMAANGGGSLVTLSSASVYALLYNHAAYIATKAAADALVRCFANEFGSSKIRVNAIAPGLTSSPMTVTEIAMPGLQEAFIKEYPLGRIGTADDVANAALWLASDESFMTGQVLQINGGLTLRRNPTPREISASMRAASTVNSQD